MSHRLVARLTHTYNTSLLRPGHGTSSTCPAVRNRKLQLDCVIARAVCWYTTPCRHRYVWVSQWWCTSLHQVAEKPARPGGSERPTTTQQKRGCVSIPVGCATKRGGCKKQTTTLVTASRLMQALVHQIKACADRSTRLCFARTGWAGNEIVSPAVHDSAAAAVEAGGPVCVLAPLTRNASMRVL